MDLTYVSELGGQLCYAGLAGVALWGAYCVILGWRRVGRLRFANEAEQQRFLDALEELLMAGDYDGAQQICREDPRAVPQLVGLAVRHRELETSRLRRLVAERFERDVLSELEYRISWVNTMIRTAPMLGLFGTVLGMMSAFGKLGLGTNKVDTTSLADDISLALITTALGLAIAIPLTLYGAGLTHRLRQLEELVGAGLTRAFEVLKPSAPPPRPPARPS